MHYNPLKDIASIRCGSIANPCTPVRFRYPPPQYVVDPLRKNNIQQQDIVRNFLYTIRTQNIGVDFYFQTLVHNNKCLWESGCELRRRIDTNTQKAEAG